MILMSFAGVYRLYFIFEPDIQFSFLYDKSKRFISPLYFQGNVVARYALNGEAQLAA